MPSRTRLAQVQGRLTGEQARGFLVLQQRFLQPFFLAVEVAEIHARRVEIRIQRHGALVTGLGFLPLALLAQQIAEVELGDGEVRLERERPAVVCSGSLQIPLVV